MALAATISLTNAGPWLHFPPVSRLYELNGLSDRFFKESDTCVQNCLTKHKSTEMTPCPVWDTGCLCIFHTFNDVWMKCVLNDCPQFAKDVEVKGIAACTKAGVPNEEVLSFSKSVKAEIEKATSQAPADVAKPKLDVQLQSEKVDAKIDVLKEGEIEAKTDHSSASITSEISQTELAVSSQVECTQVCAPARASASKVEAETPKTSATVPPNTPTAEEIANGSTRTEIAPFAAALCFVIGLWVM